MNPNATNSSVDPTPDAAAAGAILTIDLSAIRMNYRRLKKELGGTLCAGVVKADGYGLGMSQVALALLDEGCDTFFVAHVGEGISLRAHLGRSAAIYVLNGIPPGAEGDAVAADLATVINSTQQLAAWRNAAQSRGRRLPAAIQVDSGMSRLGLTPTEVKNIAADLQAFDRVEITMVMSHLACADEPNHPANEAQRLEFERLRKMLPSAPASLSNSSGIYLGQAYHYDIARPGAALYGINPIPGKINPMSPVVRLEAKVIQTRTLGSGSGVGYGHIMVTQGSLTTATIALGYADGWHRRASAAAYLDGVRLPFVGRVSMDSIILDISALPRDHLNAGDLVQLIGSSQTLDEVAGFTGTIGYEVLTSLGHRFHRVYLDQ